MHLQSHCLYACMPAPIPMRLPLSSCFSNMHAGHGFGVGRMSLAQACKSSSGFVRVVQSHEAWRSAGAPGI